jgi:phasin family protein
METNKMVKNNEQFAEATAKNLECANDFIKTSLESIEKLTALQLNASKKLLTETSEAIKEITRTNNPKDLFEKVNQLATSSVESNLYNCRSIYEIITEAQANAGKYVENQIHATQGNFVSAVDDLTKFNSSAKQSAASESIKSWLDTTNQAMNAMSKVTNQFKDIANNNIEAATKATADVVKKATAAKK